MSSSLVRAALLAAAWLSGAAFADDAPAFPKAEAAIADAIQLAVAGDHDRWLDRYGIRAHDAWSRGQWKAYQLKQAKRRGATCLHGPDKDELIVSRWRGNPDTDKRATAYIQCGDRRAVPVTVQRDDRDDSRFWIFQLSI